MASWLTRVLRGRSTLIQGTGKLPEGQAKCVDLGDPMAGGRSIVLARREGRLYALDRRCPHEGGRIAAGPLIDGKYVLCPLHNYRFDPATGKAVGVSCPDARTYKLEERNGDCEVWA
jgi:nitrite reductase/ring-hydroxylating ferredoxin subunit